MQQVRGGEWSLSRSGELESIDLFWDEPWMSSTTNFQFLWDIQKPVNSSVNYDAVVQLFAERYPQRMLLVDPVFEETQNWNKMKRSIIIFSSVLLMKICMFLRSFVILFMEKNRIFTLKNETLKQAEFASELRNRVSEDLKFKNFPGEDAFGSPYWSAAFGGLIHRTLSPKNLDPRQINHPNSSIKTLYLLILVDVHFMV